MNIILVPNSRHGKGRNATLSQRHLILIALVVFVALPVLLGVIAYRAQDMLTEYGADSLLTAQRRELAAQRTAVAEAKRNAEAHLNALRQRVRLAARENLLLGRKLNAAVTPSGWPVDGGWISSGFGVRADPFNGHQSVHEGVDIASHMGSPVLAVGDGG